jgi:hypothetical protein
MPGARGGFHPDLASFQNDAWQIATAECMHAVVVGHDARAFGRLGAGYEDHRAG